MAGTKYLLVVLEICVLFQAVYSEWLCNTSVQGRLTDFPVQLHSALLPAGIRNFNVEVPNVCNQVGVSEEVCDYDSTPELYIMSTMFASVKRTGFLFRDGIVTAKVYCPEPWSDSNIYYGGAAPSLKVKEAKESPSRNQNMPQSSTVRQNALGQARNPALNKALYTAQTVDRQQGADLTRNAMTANVRQAALGQTASLSAQEKHGMRLAEQATNAHRNILRESTQRRIRRASQSSDTRQAADLVREAKADQTRLAMLDQAQQQAAHEARRGYPNVQAQRKNQHLKTQNSSYRALLPLKSRQAADVFQKTLETNARQAALEQARSQAFNEAFGSTQTLNTLQSSDIFRDAIGSNMRQVALEQARNQALHKALYTAQTVDGRQGADLFHNAVEDNARIDAYGQSPLPKRHRIYRSIQETQAATTTTTHQSADKAHEAKEANERQSALDQTRQMNDQTTNTRRNILREPTQRHIRHASKLLTTQKRSRRALHSFDHSQAPDDFQNALVANAQQAAVLDQARHQALQQTGHTSALSQSIDARQGTEMVRGVATNARQAAALEQARRQVLQSAGHTFEGSQSIDARQVTDVFRGAIAADARQAAALDQARRQALQLTGHTSEVSKLVDARQAADVVREAMAANAHQSTGLDQAGRQILQQTALTSKIGQGFDGRQAADVVRQILAANARQSAALDQARRQALSLTGRTSEGGQVIDARQAADVVREAIETNTYQAAYNQAQEAQRFPHANQAVNNRLIADARHGILEEQALGIF